MYLVIGANGFLGSYCIKSIMEQTEEKIVATARSTWGLSNSGRICWLKCDITQKTEFDRLVSVVKEYDRVKVIFLAAYHNPDQVAQNPQYAWDVNVTALSRCINKLSFVDRLFYASTDSVYGDSIDFYHFKETDPLNPVNAYGKNKAAAEAVVRYSGFHVVRFPFLIGECLIPGRKHFYDRITEDLKEGKTVEMYENSYRSSLHFKTASQLLVRLMEMQETVPSVLNVCGDKDLSKYDVGIRIADQLGVPHELIKPVQMMENDGVFKTKRAVSTLMDNTLVKKILHLDTIDFQI